MGAALVGLAGYAGSGKDAAGDALLEDGWARFSPSDQIRTVLYAQNPHLSVEGVTIRSAVDAYGWDEARLVYPEIRQLQQRTGDACRDLFGDFVLMDAAMDPLADGLAVCTSLRFPFEADAIRARGGLVMRIVRPGVGPTVSPDGSIHHSETALDDYDFDATILNNGSLGRLHMLIRLMVA